MYQICLLLKSILFVSDQISTLERDLKKSRAEAARLLEQLNHDKKKHRVSQLRHYHPVISSPTMEPIPVKDVYQIPQVATSRDIAQVLKLLLFKYICVYI